MREVYRYDDNGNFIEPVLVNDGQEIPFRCTDQKLPQPNYKPVFKNGKWVETITQEELDEILSRPLQKSEIEVIEERLALSESAIDFILMNGGL